MPPVPATEIALSVPNLGTRRAISATWTGRGAVLAALLALAACQAPAQPSAAEPELPPDQHARAEVLEAFLADPDQAARRYREVWDERGVSDTGEFTLLAIAQGMVQHHRGDPSEYLRYATHKTRSQDPNVIEAALWVFSGADDEGSLQALFDQLPDQRGTVSMSAESVIAYRRAAAREHPERAEDAARIDAFLGEWCADPKHAQRPLCIN